MYGIWTSAPLLVQSRTWKVDIHRHLPLPAPSIMSASSTSSPVVAALDPEGNGATLGGIRITKKVTLHIVSFRLLERLLNIQAIYVLYIYIFISDILKKNKKIKTQANRGILIPVGFGKEQSIFLYRGRNHFSLLPKPPLPYKIRGGIAPRKARALPPSISCSKRRLLASSGPSRNTETK